MGLMRSLEIQTVPEFPFPRFYKNMQDAIGQMVYDSPSVFSFFVPGHQPDGVVAKAGLVSPEMEIHSSPGILSLMNGAINTIKYGMDRCYDGFGKTKEWSGSGEVNLFVPVK